jgi:hypothetical protein
MDVAMDIDTDNGEQVMKKKRTLDSPQAYSLPPVYNPPIKNKDPFFAYVEQLNRKRPEQEKISSNIEHDIELSVIQQQLQPFTNLSDDPNVRQAANKLITALNEKNNYVNNTFNKPMPNKRRFGITYASVDETLDNNINEALSELKQTTQRYPHLHQLLGGKTKKILKKHKSKSMIKNRRNSKRRNSKRRNSKRRNSKRQSTKRQNK